MKIQSNLRAAANPVPAGWYKAVASGKKYKNFVKSGREDKQYPFYEFTLLSESDQLGPNEPSTIGRKVFQGITADWMMVRLYKAANNLSDEELPTEEYDDDDVLQKEMLIEVTHETYTPSSGKPELRIRVNDFKAI